MSDWNADGEPIPVQVPARADRADRSEAEFAALVDELEATLRDLRTQVARDAARDRDDGPAFPQPPSVAALLRFTERYTIPATVALLEAAIQGLELLGGAIRLLDGRDPRPDRSDRRWRRERDAGDVLDDVSTVASDRAARGGRRALARVDDALEHLQRTYEGDPNDPAARRLLADARELRAEIDDRLSTLEREGREPDAGTGREAGPAVDVDAELASLKEDARDDEPTPPGDREGTVGGGG